MCEEGASYKVKRMKPLEFFDDFADPDKGLCQSRRSNNIIVAIMQQKCHLLLLTNATF